MRWVAEAAQALAASTGFTASELAEKVHSMEESADGARRAAYDLKKLHRKGMVHKIGTHGAMRRR